MVNENGILIDESDPNYELYRDQAEELEEKKPKAKTIKEKTDTETQPKPIEPKSEPTGTIETGILGNAPSPKTKFIKEPDIDKVLSDKTPKPKIEGDPTEFEEITTLPQTKPKSDQEKKELKTIAAVEKELKSAKEKKAKLEKAVTAQPPDPKGKLEGDPTEFEKSTPLDELKEINKGDRTPLTQANLDRLKNERQKFANVKKVFDWLGLPDFNDPTKQPDYVQVAKDKYARPTAEFMLTMIPLVSTAWLSNELRKDWDKLDQTQRQNSLKWIGVSAAFDLAIVTKYTPKWVKKGIFKLIETTDDIKHTAKTEGKVGILPVKPKEKINKQNKDILDNITAFAEKYSANYTPLLKNAKDFVDDGAKKIEDISKAVANTDPDTDQTLRFIKRQLETGYTDKEANLKEIIKNVDEKFKKIYEAAEKAELPQLPPFKNDPEFIKKLNDTLENHYKKYLEEIGEVGKKVTRLDKSVLDELIELLDKQLLSGSYESAQLAKYTGTQFKQGAIKLSKQLVDDIEEILKKTNENLKLDKSLKDELIKIIDTRFEPVKDFIEESSKLSDLDDWNNIIFSNRNRIPLKDSPTGTATKTQQQATKTQQQATQTKITPTPKTKIESQTTPKKRSPTAIASPPKPPIKTSKAADVTKEEEYLRDEKGRFTATPLKPKATIKTAEPPDVTEEEDLLYAQRVSSPAAPPAPTGKAMIKPTGEEKAIIEDKTIWSSIFKLAPLPTTTPTPITTTAKAKELAPTDDPAPLTAPAPLPQPKPQTNHPKPPPPPTTKLKTNDIKPPDDIKPKARGRLPQLEFPEEIEEKISQLNKNNRFLKLVGWRQGTVNVFYNLKTNKHITLKKDPTGMIKKRGKPNETFTIIETGKTRRVPQSFRMGNQKVTVFRNAIRFDKLKRGSI